MGTMQHHSLTEKFMLLFGASQLDIDIRRLKAIIKKTDVHLENIERQVPQGVPCCHGCYLAATSPEYTYLMHKQTRRQAWLEHLEERRRIRSLGE